MNKSIGKRRSAARTAALLALALLISLLPVSAAAADETETWADGIPAMLAAAPYAEGEVIAAVDAAYADSFDLLAFLGLREALDGEALMTAPAEGARSGAAELTLLRDPTRTTEELLYALAGDQRVAFAEPNYRMAPTALTDVVGGTGAGYPAQTELPDLTGLQWGPKAIHTPGWPDGSNMDGEPIIVAVMDGAVDFTHPDLAPVAYEFTPELQSKLGCGAHGFNVLADDGVPVISPDDPDADHGTHVAGIIGAAWDGSGISGVASNVRILNVQIYDEMNLDTMLAAVIRGYDFIRAACAEGVDIRLVNNSWGDPRFSLAVNAAVRALGEDYGVLSVFSAGNDGTDLKDYPNLNATLADNPWVVVVGAGAGNDELASYSTWSDTLVDLSAPGSAILSSVTPVMASYLPDAESVWYEGFEGNAIRFSLTQSNAGSTACAVVDDRYQSGAHSLRVALDPDAFSSDDLLTYQLTLELQDAPPFASYLGLSIYGTDLMWIDTRKDGETGEAILVDAPGICYGYVWSTAWMDLSADYACLLDADTDILSVQVDLVALSPVDTVWIDAVGLGSVRVPYQYMSGTSMAAPMVTGAAAVLAAQTGLRGEALADALRTKLRSVDALEGLVATGAVLDFDGGAVTPPAPEPAPDRPLYETELPLDTNTGDPYCLDENLMGDAETAGYLAGLGDTLYYLPATSVPEEFTEFVSRTVYAFDLNTRTWSAASELPEMLVSRTVSFTACGDYLYAMGQTLETLNAGGDTYKVYALQPKFNGYWEERGAEGIEGGAWKLFEMDGRLCLLSCGRPEDEGQTLEPATLCYYVDGAGEKLMDLERAYDPDATFVAAGQSKAWIYDSVNYVLDMVIPGGDGEAFPIALPEAYAPGGVPVVMDNGFLLLVGLSSEDGSADTWLEVESEWRLLPMRRKAAANGAICLAATVHQGQLYVIGSSAGEPEARFFRANDVNTLDEPLPGGDPVGYYDDPVPAEQKDETKTQPPAVTYTDVPADAWYAPSVAYVTEKGLFEGFGDGTFRPEAEMDRAMAVQVLWKLAGKPGVNRALPFGDVSGDDWFSEAVRWAFGTGVTNGTGENFDPNAPVTREQFAAMLYRYAQASGKGFDGLWSFRLDFPDADAVSDWAREGMSWLVMNGILKGMDGNLNPQGVLTRAQAAALLERAAAVLG